jgi:hypothetical protein
MVSKVLVHGPLAVLLLTLLLMNKDVEHRGVEVRDNIHLSKPHPRDLLPPTRPLLLIAYSPLTHQCINPVIRLVPS